MKTLVCLICGNEMTRERQRQTRVHLPRLCGCMTKCFKFCGLCLHYVESTTMGGRGKCLKKKSFAPLVGMPEFCRHWKRSNKPMGKAWLQFIKLVNMLEETTNADAEDDGE